MKRIKLIRLEEDFIDESNIYSEDARDLLLEEDELNPVEAAFMKGWQEAG